MEKNLLIKNSKLTSQIVILNKDVEGEFSIKSAEAL
jgi:hypothetical protein